MAGSPDTFDYSLIEGIAQGVKTMKGCLCCGFRYSSGPCLCGGNFCERCLRCDLHCRCEEARAIITVRAITTDQEPANQEALDPPVFAIPNR